MSGKTSRATVRLFARLAGEKVRLAREGRTPGLARDADEVRVALQEVRRMAALWARQNHKGSARR